MFLLESNNVFLNGSSFHFTWSNRGSIILFINHLQIHFHGLINIYAVKTKLLARLQADVFYLSKTQWCLCSCQRTFAFAVLTSPLTLWLHHLWEGSCFQPHLIQVVCKSICHVVDCCRRSYDCNSFYLPSKLLSKFLILKEFSPKIRNCEVQQVGRKT